MSKRFLVLLLILALAMGAVPITFASQGDASPQSTLPAQDDMELFSWLTECEEDLTGETITYYHFGDLSGPLAFLTQPLLVGQEDFLNMLNSNGGLCGAEVVVEYRDTGGAIEQAQAFYDEFSARDDAHAIILYGSPEGELLKAQAEEDQIVLLNFAGSELAVYGESGAEPGYEFIAIPLYTDQLGVFCDFISENWDEYGVEGDPVIGHLSWEGAFGRSSDTEGTQAYCESVGVGYAGAEYFLPGTADLTTQLQTLLDDGANIIYTTSLASGPAQVAGTVSAMGVRDQVVLGGVNWALDTTVVALGGESVNGLIGNLPYTWWDEVETEPSIQVIAGYWQENRLAVDPESAVRLRGLTYITSMAAVDLWVEAMIRAINEVGYENLDGEALYNVVSNMQYGPLMGTFFVDYTDGNRAGAQTRVGQIQFLETDAGVTPAVVPLTEWTTEIPDLRIGGADIPE
jgi:ABC-type branched-subunit amino acid transport system substrate-binding protein